jgi:phenylalanyl-tRNA synthetase alpha chain
MLCGFGSIARSQETCPRGRPEGSAVETIRQQFEKEAAQAGSPDDVEALRVKYLGRKGIVTQLRKETDFKSMSPDQRRDFGRRFNELKTFVETAVAEAAENRKAKAKPAAQIDLSLPGSERRIGSLHPITLVQMEIERFFQAMGFMVLTGYDVETEHYNFDALNTPSDHPGREMQDTFWLTNGMVLRTQTSANQVRALEEYGAPLRAIFPGRCFRYEAVDASHENTFYQLEGLMVDRDISVANLIAVMKALLSEVFHRDVTVRLRPGFFPFVEPGFELDIQCLICGGDGCQTCKRTGWIELLPCGLVHPRVLEFGRIDTEKFSGFAFGLGLTRLAMMKYNIPEIRLLNSGDIRFHQQFPAAV